MKKMSFGDKFYTICVSIIAIIVVIIAFYPVLYVVSASFSNPSEIALGHVALFPKGFSLSAYSKVIDNDNMLLGFRNTIYYSFLGTAINLAMTLIAAYALSKPDMVGRNFITFMITFTMFFSGGMIPTYLNLKSLHMLNTTWSLVIPGAISVTNMLIVRNYITNSIPGEIIDAAEIDGCSLIRTLFEMIIPLAKPVLAVIFIYYFSGHWNSYFSALLYIRDRDRYPLQVFLREILLVNQMSTLGETVSLGDDGSQALLFEAMKYAVIVVSSLPVIIMYPFIQKNFAKGIMIGSVKG